MRKRFIAGNWKMNKNLGDATAYAAEFLPLVKDVTDAEMVLCVPATLLDTMATALKGSNVGLSGQNMFYADKGAYTGEISPSMVREFASYIIVGHSERRSIFHESDEIVNKKVKKALDYGFTVIFCLGETLEQREADETKDVVRSQLLAGLSDVKEGKLVNIVVAYEPVWAIGTGKTATPEQAQEIHAYLRSVLSETYSEDAAEKIRIIYGGSVKPFNAEEILSMPDIDGALPGGASLDPESFSQIIKA